MTTDKLVTAVKGSGFSAEKIELGKKVHLSHFSDRGVVQKREFPPIEESAGLFPSGSIGEMRFVELLRTEGTIETAYRFGGFGTECMRLALGYEEFLIQLTPKAWDFSAALFAIETGFEVVMDPLGEQIDYSDWEVKPVNPLLICAPEHRERLLEALPRSIIGL